jgi:hypothetical protein
MSGEGTLAPPAIAQGDGRGKKMNEIGRLLLVFGLVLAAVGLVFIFADKIPFLGRLPGDILIRKKNVTIFFPLATMILISIVLTVILNLFFRRH